MDRSYEIETPDNVFEFLERIIVMITKYNIDNEEITNSTKYIIEKSKLFHKNTENYNSSGMDFKLKCVKKIFGLLNRTDVGDSEIILKNINETCLLQTCFPDFNYYIEKPEVKNIISKECDDNDTFIRIKFAIKKIILFNKERELDK